MKISLAAMTMQMRLLLPAVHSNHHTHSHSGQSRRALTAALLVTAAFAVVEVVAGVLTNSLALIADSVHMFSDSASLGLALFAAWLATRPSTSKHSFGYKRAEILAALANGVALVAVAIWIFIEAVQRLANPPDVNSGWMLAVALVGASVNLASISILRHSGSDNLNVKAAARHVLGDLLGSIGTAAAALVIILSSWLAADPLISILIGLLILVSSWSILKESANILLESTPEGIDTEEVGQAMVSVKGVVEVHDLHIWTVTSGFPALAAHVLVGVGEDCHQLRRQLEATLSDSFGVTHTTLQVDHVTDKPELLGVDSLFPDR